MSSAVQELLTILSAPPSANAPTSQSTYHVNLQSLRDAGDKSFLFLRSILELTSNSAALQQNPQHSELLFHAVLGFRHVTLYRWANFSKNFRNICRDFLLGLGLGFGLDVTLPKTIANACLGSSAAFWKRTQGAENLAEESQEETHLLHVIESHQTSAPNLKFFDISGLFESLEHIVSFPFNQNYDQNQLHMAVMACVFLTSIIGEFGGSNTAASYNCALEFHRAAHHSFEDDGKILDLLKISMGGLSGIVSKLGSDKNLIELAGGVVNLTIEVLGWEFGSLGGKWGRTGGSGLVRPPEIWREYLIRPDFLGAVFEVYTSARSEAGSTAVVGQLKHSLRQLLILLASITGIVFEDRSQKVAYSGFMVDGCMSVLSILMIELTDGSRSVAQSEHLESETVDMCCMINRLVTNFRVEGLSSLPNFQNMLYAISSVGDALLRTSVAELKDAQGDAEMVDGGEWRNEALGMILEAVCLLTEDHWLISARPGNSQDIANNTLSTSLAPLYHSYVTCRIEMAKMEEYYLTTNAADLDEVREEIAGASMDEEMTSASSLGRVNVASSLSCLSTLLQSCMPQLKTLFSTDSHDVSPEAAALLEEARLLIMCTCHLLSDESSGETPLIPESILNACSKPSDSPRTFKTGSDDYASSTLAVSQIVTTLMGLAELQASKIAANPNNPHLSPLLAKTLLWFFTRWSPAYILPSTREYDPSRLECGSDSILATWSAQDSSQQALSFCMTLCLHYLAYWPQEVQVIEGCAELLLALAKRGRNMRLLLMSSPSMDHLCNLHSLTAGQIHASSHKVAPSDGLSAEMIAGYKRIPYRYRAQILSALLISSSEIDDAKSEAYFSKSLQAVQNAFNTLIDALQSKKVRIQDVFTLEMICLCVELFGGISRSSEMCHPERIPIFMSPCLPQLSSLMMYYASDITICEILLRLFRDYTEQFIVMLNRDQCLAVFRASADLLKSYSTNHCAARVVRKAINKSAEEELEEEQSYNDVLCAIQLLNNIGAKDFIDTFSLERTGGKGVESSEVIEVVFFGLQQILPLMTKGLLHFPTLCKQYFSLLGFMMETYPQKVGILPYDLFKGLLDSMLFGMSHTDSFVSKNSLQGIASLAREQIENGSLNAHLAQIPSMFDDCTRRLLQEVIFQTIIWDSMEPAANALLPLAAVDMNRFATVVNTITLQLDAAKQQKMQAAFERLMQPDVLAKVAKGNYGGRLNKMRFRKDFEVFVKEVHSSVLVF